MRGEAGVLMSKATGKAIGTAVKKAIFTATGGIHGGVDTVGAAIFKDDANASFKDDANASFKDQTS